MPLAILAFDTASPQPALAFKKGDEVRSLAMPPRQLAETMPAAITEILGATRFSELDLLAASSGPGPFMSLRAGLAAARALALALDLPLRAVPRAQCVMAAAINTPPTDAPPLRALVCLAASSGRVFVQAYQNLTPLDEGVALPLEAVSDFVKQHAADRILDPDGALSSLPDLPVLVDKGASPALSLAHLAEQFHLQGKSSPPPLPLYLPAPTKDTPSPFAP